MYLQIYRQTSYFFCIKILKNKGITIKCPRKKEVKYKDLKARDKPIDVRTSPMLIQ